MKLATDEQILKTYNYATVGKVSDTLTITNKRVVLTTEGKLSDGSTVHATDEMMLEGIERVSAALATKRNTFFLILSLLFFALGIVVLSGIISPTKTVCIVPFIVAVICLIVFFLNKKQSFFLVLTSRIHEGMDLSIAVGTWSRKKTNKTIQIKVDEATVSQIIDEIGSIIVESKNI